MKKLSTHKLMAAATTAILATQAGAALAAPANFTNVTGNIVTSSSTLPNLISTAAYIGGIGMGVTGVFKLKQHVDQPAQNPMKDGLVRLGAGGGFLALPAITDAMTGTIGAHDTGPDIDKFDAIKF